MKVWSDSFSPGAFLPESLAFCRIHPETHVTMAENRNPHLGWSDLPDGTGSLALICHDPDVPSCGDDVNQEGRVVAASLARVDFYHWVLLDLDPGLGAIEEGAFSKGVTVGGKGGPEAPCGAKQGINDYTGWFGDDPEMGGHYFGYDGPCPPWNDTLMHHYHFTLYALDIAHVDLEGAFDGAAALEAIEGHVLAKASITGVYTLNPELVA